MFTDPVTGELKNGISEVRWHHDAVIDFMLANPTAKQGEIARIFKRTEGWVSLMINSDAFRARLAERKADLVDPLIVAEVKDRLQAVAAASLDRMLEKLTGPLPPEDKFVLESAKLATSALGYGARAVPGGNTTNVAVVVNVPSKVSQSEWAARYSRTPGEVVAETGAPAADPPALPEK